MNTTLPIHALARTFPAQLPDVYEAMKGNIDAIGQLQPIAVWQGQVLDGAHRYRACLELGIEPEYNYLADDTDPIAFVVSANKDKGRVLNSTQLEVLAYRLSEWSTAGGDRKSNQVDNCPLDHPRQQEAAELVGVTDRGVRRAAKVLRPDSNAAPELRQALEAGAVPSSAAAAVVDKPKDVQVQAIQRVAEAQAKGQFLPLKRAANAVAKERARATQLAQPRQGNSWVWIDGKESPAIPAMLQELEQGHNVIGVADAIDVLQALPDNSVDLLLTDIPYARVNKPTGGLRTLDKGDANAPTFNILDFAAEAVRVTSGNAIIFCGKEQFSHLYEHFDDRGITTRMMVWEKTNPSPMNAEVMFVSGVECAVHFRKDRATFNATYQNTVFRFPTGSSLRHPTEKPLDMFKTFIEILSNPGALVCDPCMGSGTTAVAAHQGGRRYLCSDINLEPANVARSRLLEGGGE